MNKVAISNSSSSFVMELQKVPGQDKKRDS